MRTSETTAELDAALSKAQGEMTAASKDRTNPAFKQGYATLASAVDAVREPLARHGLSLTQWPRLEDGRVVLTTRLAHASGQYIVAELTMTPQKSDPQGIGSAITYARRYALMAACGIAPDDDDDGQAASKPAPRAQKRETPEERTARQAEHHPSWEADRARFCAACDAQGVEYNIVAAWRDARGLPKPSAVDQAERTKFFEAAVVRGSKGRALLDAWIDERDAKAGA